jgi:hypothetical protein
MSTKALIPNDMSTTYEIRCYNLHDPIFMVRGIELDNNHRVTWRRGGAPHDLPPMMNHWDICHSTHRRNLALIPNVMHTMYDWCRYNLHRLIIMVRDFRKLDNYHWVTWRRGGTPWDLAPTTNHWDIRPSTHRWYLPMQSCHIDVKERIGWTEVRCSTIPSGIERTMLARHSCLTKGSQISYPWEENTHKVAIFSYSTLTCYK